MKAANTSTRFLEDSKLLVFSGTDEITHSKFGKLHDFLNPGDLLVVNRSATLPSSFRGYVEKTGEFIELRLAAFQGPSIEDLSRWQALSFGEGDWRQPTELRSLPPKIKAQDKIIFSDDLYAVVEKVNNQRLLNISFKSASLIKSLYQCGRPIQYSYHESDLEVWDQQTLFSGPPISVEPPSASFQFTWKMLFDLQRKGVKIAHLIHSAGISSSGDKKIDNMLPLAEWYEVPKETVQTIKKVKASGHRVVALGTTVLRALEAASSNGKLEAKTGLAKLKIRPGHNFCDVDALITGMHEPGSSHMEILDSLCPISLVRKGYLEARELDYRGHEYGDLSLLNCFKST